MAFQRKNAVGFALLEVLLALFFLMMVLFGAYTVVWQQRAMLQRLSSALLADVLLNNVFELFRLSDSKADRNVLWQDWLYDTRHLLLDAQAEVHQEGARYRVCLRWKNQKGKIVCQSAWIQALPYWS